MSLKNNSVLVSYEDKVPHEVPFRTFISVVLYIIERLFGFIKVKTATFDFDGILDSQIFKKIK